MATFILTPDEAQGVARSVVTDLRQKRYTVSVEVPVADDAPYRPTIRGRRADLEVLVEAQGRPQYTSSFRDLVAWASQTRRNCELYIATSVDAAIPGQLLTNLRRDGVGLILVNGSEVTTSYRARNPALVVTPDPTLRFGHRKSAVEAAVEKFNHVDRKAGLQEMCELVEGETEILIRKAARAGALDKSVTEVERMDWSTQINVLAASDRYLGGRSPVVSPRLKDDLQSFKGARNLLDHKVRSQAERRRRERQYAERMMMGPRLVAELVPLARKL